MIGHVVLTRFNIATSGREARIRNQAGWLSGRFDLFERYCLPSMAAQTSRDFRWLVFFDEATPGEFVSRIEECRKLACFEPVFSGLFPASGWGDAVQSAVGPEAEYVLTTRLDNDDAICPSFLATLRAEAEQLLHRGASVPFALNWTRGAILSSGAVYIQEHRSNAFLSLIEPCGRRPRTVMGHPHMSMRSYCRVFQCGDRPGWLQVVHGGNVSNKIRGRRAGAAALIGCFDCLGNLGVRSVSGWRIWLENLLLLPARWMRDCLARVVRTVFVWVSTRGGRG